jgi:1-acyl-sn-glycerol-3-phosphate acyltransferase
MGAPKNALQLPMKLEDYKPVSYATTACLFAIAIAGWVATWCAQMAFTYSVGLTMSKKRLEFWNGYIFRLLAAAPVANLTPGVTVTKTRTSWAPTKAMTDGESPVMVICNHRSYMDPFALASALLPLETKYVAKSDLFKVPFGGWAMKNAGDLAVRFDANKNAGWGTVKGSTGQLLAQAAAHFEAGNSVCIFPEGARMGISDEKCLEAKAHPSKLMLFKPAFFDLCKKQGVPVVPVSWARTRSGPAAPCPCGRGTSSSTSASPSRARTTSPTRPSATPRAWPSATATSTSSRPPRGQAP